MLASTDRSTDASFDAWHVLIVLLRGCGNLCFQSNAATGLIFLLAVAVHSRVQLAGMLIGAVIGPLVGHLLRENRSTLEAGRYGFSPCLVGLAISFYLEPGPAMFSMLVVGCILSAVITRIALHLAPFPIFASPYIVTAWGLFWLARLGGVPMADHASSPPGEFHIGQAIVEGMGSALFSANWISGVLQFAGLALSNPKHALVAVIGSSWGVLIATLNHDPTALVQTGYYGFNGVLCSVSTYLFCGPSLRLPMLGAIVSTMLIDPFVRMGLQPLGAPFVLTTWAMLALGLLEKALGMGSPPNANAPPNANSMGGPVPGTPSEKPPIEVRVAEEAAHTKI